MLCPPCRAVVPTGARFCPGCGQPLPRACPRCATANAPDHRFCKSCGAPLGEAAPEPGALVSSRVALEGERKHVTVLFADLKSSMELLAARDPEDARAVLDPVLDGMIQAVRRYGGTVNQVMGDGIMALFGAPIAVEDHPVRAGCAARAREAAAGGRGQVVAVVGEPGVGKSRVCHELVRRASAQGQRVIAAACLSYGASTPYLPIGGLLEALLDLDARAEPPERRARAIARLAGLDAELGAAAAPLLALLEVPTDAPAWAALDPPHRRQRTLHALRQLLLQAARQQELSQGVERALRS